VSREGINDLEFKLRLWFPELAQHCVDSVERGINLFSDLSTSQNNFPRYKDEQHDLGFDHAVDETRKELWFITAELPVAVCQSFQPNGELDIATTHNVLNLEF